MANVSASDDIVEKSLLAGLSRSHPSASDAIAMTRLERREDSNPLFHVGAYRALERFARVQVDRGNVGRRVYFAGDYLVGPTANHALVSGRRAAATLQQHFST